MTEYRSGDILSDPDLTIVVIPTNSVERVMGKGLAKQAAAKYPGLKQAYKQLRGDFGRQIGVLYVYAKAWPLVVCLPTKKSWRDKSTLDQVYAGLYDLRVILTMWDNHVVGIPALGCGLGGLAWPDVRDVIELHMGGVKNHRIIVYEPQETAP